MKQGDSPFELGQLSGTARPASDWQAALRLLGLGARARTVVCGVDIVRGEASRDKVRLAILAKDAAENSVKKVAPLLKARGVTYLVGPAAIELGASVGRPAVAVVGVLDGKLADGIMRAVGITGQLTEEER